MSTFISRTPEEKSSIAVLSPRLTGVIMVAVLKFINVYDDSGYDE